MERKWLITAVLVVMMAIGYRINSGVDRTHANLLNSGQFSVLGATSMLNLNTSSQFAAARISALELARGPQIAAIPSNAPVFLDVNGGQNLRPLATYFSQQVRYR